MSASLRATAGVELRVAPGFTPYGEAVAFMEARVADIHAGRAGELVWFVEHPPLYTAGTSARDADLIAPGRFPVFKSGRGGQYTYHGPGQRVIYAMLDLNRRGKDVRRYVNDLERWGIAALARVGIRAEPRADRVGLWVARENGREDKIAAIGVRVRHWVTFHGMAINVAPDLGHYAGIVPCGISQHGVTSIRDLGLSAGMDALDQALLHSFPEIFRSELRATTAADSPAAAPPYFAGGSIS